jgi:hypothetical protein
VQCDFFVHHTQKLAAAAQVGDAKGIRKKITEMKPIPAAFIEYGCEKGVQGPS